MLFPLSSSPEITSPFLNEKLHIATFFFICYLDAPRPILGHYRGDSLTHAMLITLLSIKFQPKGHWESHNGVGSLTLAKCLAEDDDDDDDDDDELFFWYFCGMADQQRAFSLQKAFPARTIVRDPHHCQSLTCCEQDLNKCRAWVQAWLNEVM